MYGVEARPVFLFISLFFDIFPTDMISARFLSLQIDICIFRFYNSAFSVSSFPLSLLKIFFELLFF